MTNGNEPAFSKAAFYHPDGGVDRPQEGLSKREYFAAMAMNGLLVNSGHIETFSANNPNPVPEYVAELSVSLADALIQELNEKPCNE